ncbi:putative Uncultured bacterium genome assembly Metasoil_fosmids_resub [uncultured Defluviicoccus sp.]|uniref:Putative Uncultured bacterium genome assembly Metasoil_fosmids_resub n=1 Tax=metagenome TaxID=256318 RepID=A0A380TI98_9ZZZZ|nr:putative Uncultured bacterium genome assembly Metasoil_fosmids_resub [uncultured Defluviicoccus sp.]
MQLKFTASAIARIPLSDRGQQFIWDTQLAGLGLSVGTKSKSYIAQFRGSRITLGRVDDLTLGDARSKALEYIESIKRGRDPSAERAAERTKAERLSTMTLQVALDETLAAKAQYLRPRTQSDYRNSVRLYFDCWLDRPLHTITARDVATRFAEVVEGRNLGQRRDNGKFANGDPSVRGGKTVAAKAFVVFRVIWNYMRWKYEDLGLPECPVKGLGQVSRGWARVNSRDRVVADVPRFIAAARSYPSPIQRDLVLFILATGLRMNEACMLRWEEVGLHNAVINIPAERMKANRPLIIPLCRMAHECLQRRAEAGREEYVFIGRREARGKRREPFATVSKKMLRHLADQTGQHVSVHDLRRTWSSQALAAGIPLHITEYLTAHVPQGVTLTHYWSISMDELRAEVAKLDAVLS